MTGFETLPENEDRRSAPVQSLHRRTMMAVIALLVAIAAAALAPAGTHASPPSGGLVLACGSSPGPC